MLEFQIQSFLIANRFRGGHREQLAKIPSGRTDRSLPGIPACPADFRPTTHE